MNLMHQCEVPSFAFPMTCRQVGYGALRLMPIEDATRSIPPTYGWDWHPDIGSEHLQIHIYRVGYLASYLLVGEIAPYTFYDNTEAKMRKGEVVTIRDRMKFHVMRLLYVPDFVALQRVVTQAIPTRFIWEEAYA